MENIFIKETNATPKIVLDSEKNIIKIEGESYPENALLFYEPIIEWIENLYSDKSRNIQVELKLTYLNTSSTKVITDLLGMTQDFHNNHGKIHLKLYYEQDDDDSYDTAMVFIEDHSFPYELIGFIDE